MKNLEKYKGIIPAFYACYNDDGSISRERTMEFTRHLINKGVKGLYVCGSSGECIYQSKEERKTILESVMQEAKGKITIIAHVGCNNTADSMELAAHAESMGVDAIASIPPIYFHLPDHAIAEYWNDISSAAPNTDFIIYNIPQLAGVALNLSLYREMLKNPRVIGVKNSSVSVQDIQMFKDVKGDECVVFNGPDEQLVSGLAIGADGGIGGTYAVMPELYLKIKELTDAGEISKAREIQNDADRIIYEMCVCHGNLYAVMKEILKEQGLNLGGVRKPLPPVIEQDFLHIEKCKKMIKEAISRI
ncbi:dihydrodipicolinate synthase family protein [Roseburia hominis]